MTTMTYAPASVRIASRGADQIAVTDLSGFADWIEALPETAHTRSVDRAWCGGMDYRAARSAVRHGDMAGVAASDALLARFESDLHPTAAWRTIPAVAGGAANVGAYLAGSPVAMRQRRRVIRAENPLTVLVDVVSSAGISAKDLQKRGAAALALVRVLSATRAVSVYAVAGMQQHGKANSFIAVRLEQPLDLARAAFALAHPAFGRALTYEAGPRLVGCEATGSLHWAWRDIGKYRHKARDLYAGALGLNPQDCLFLPPPHMDDQSIRDGAAWLKDMVATWGGEAAQAA
jgi:hypothetical protein